jgi:aminoglycoside phosphotransferase (APT) family kinase protein
MQCVLGRVDAVIDWEIWSIGDPRFDLAWFCMMMDPRHPTADPSGAHVVSPADIIDRYQTSTGEVVQDYDWFLAATCYKQSAASALLTKRAVKRGELTIREQNVRDSIAPLLHWALDLLRSIPSDTEPREGKAVST